MELMDQSNHDAYAEGYLAGRWDEHSAHLDAGRRSGARALFRRMAHYLAHLDVNPGRVARRVFTG